MKQKKMKKLIFAKQTIANLRNSELKGIKGGTAGWTGRDNTCPEHTCPLPGTGDCTEANSVCPECKPDTTANTFEVSICPDSCLTC